MLLNVHRNRGLIRDGEPRTATSTFTQFLSPDSFGLVNMVLIMSTETIKFMRDGEKGKGIWRWVLG